MTEYVAVHIDDWHPVEVRETAALLRVFRNFGTSTSTNNMSLSDACREWMVGRPFYLKHEGRGLEQKIYFLYVEDAIAFKLVWL